jgi:subfamily B ATP-binding cassette protein MsbA
MRKDVQARRAPPVGYFDSTKSGELLSRIMNDAEGIRNLVGTGLVELVGGLVTGGRRVRGPPLALLEADAREPRGAAPLRRRHDARLQELRPLFRERGKIQAEVSGRLVESLGGIRIVKAFTARSTRRSCSRRARTSSSATSAGR